MDQDPEAKRGPEARPHSHQLVGAHIAPTPHSPLLFQLTLHNNTELCAQQPVSATGGGWHRQGSLLRSRGASEILDLYPTSATGQPYDSRGISSLRSRFPHLEKTRDLNEATQDCFQAQYPVQITLDPWWSYKLALRNKLSCPRDLLWETPRSPPG